MKILAIISRKGGAGKTTLAIHLAAAAEAAGISTAIFDLDPQASAAVWSDRRDGKAPAVIPAQAPRLPALLAQARKQEAGLVILDTARRCCMDQQLSLERQLSDFSKIF